MPRRYLFRLQDVKPQPEISNGVREEGHIFLPHDLEAQDVENTLHVLTPVNIYYCL